MIAALCGDTGKKEIMKKKLFTLFIAFVMVFALAACGGSGESEDAAPAEKTTVNVFAGRNNHIIKFLSH